MKKKIKHSENLWSKIESESSLEGDLEKDDSGKGGSSGASRGFTGLPFSKTVNKTTAIAMVDVKAENAKFVVALDGYIPNSDARLHYPPIFITDPPSKKKKKPKSTGNEFIETILSKHLAKGKISDVKSRTFNKEVKSRKKTHYPISESDAITVQNEVTDHFNFEFDQLVSEKIPERPSVKISKRKRLPSMKTSLQNLRSKISFLKTQEVLIPRAISKSELHSENSTEDIDMDILDKLDKKIEEGSKHGSLNEKVQARIIKDRQCKMDEEELQRCIILLEEKYGSTKLMYNEISKSLNKNYEATSLLENYIQTRQKRLEFLNTITDPQHLFKFLLNFYNNKSDLLNIIQDILMGGDEVNLRQLILFCGEHYKLKDFFAEFVAAKNYAQQILSKNISSEKERRIDLEKSMQGETISHNIIFNIFMSSEPDAKRFFECISECRMKEMISIIERMKDIKLAQKKLAAEMSIEAPTISETLTENTIQSIIRKPTLDEIPISAERSLTIHLPALPEYNENSWKMMMSEYIAKMVSNITPDIQLNIEAPKVYFEDENLLELMKELSFLHSEVLRLLTVYLNNDTENAKKLLNGLVAEDNLAYQALIELIGEKEAMQIIKSIRLKQAKVIEKIIEYHGDKKFMGEASLLLRSMSHDLPESLCKNLMTWLNAGQVSAEDIIMALNILTLKSRSSDSSEPYSKSAADNSDFIFNKRSRKSIINFTLPADEEIEITKGPLRRGSMMRGKIEFDYRDIPKRDSSTDGVISFERKCSIRDSIPQIENDSDSIEDFESSKKISQISEILTDTNSLILIEERVIESNICQEICNNPWFKSEPVAQYVDVVLKLTNMLTETKNLEEAVAITATIATVAEHTADKDINEVIVNKLIGQAMGLMKEEEKEQRVWINILKKQHNEEKAIIKEILVNKEKEAKKEKLFNKEKFEKLEFKSIRIDEITKINLDKVIRTEENKTLEVAIKLSYEKNQRIRKIIEILKNFESEKAGELEKVINNKIASCTLFVPEFSEHINAIRNLGMRFYQPHELVNVNPDVIMRRDEEEINRTTIKSNKTDEIKSWLHSQKSFDDLPFWEKALSSAKTKRRQSKETILTYTMSREATSEEKPVEEDKLDDAVTLMSYSDNSAESTYVVKESLPSDNVEILQIPPVYKHVSSTSQMKMNDAITITPLILKGEVYKGKYVKESIIIKDDISYDIEESRLFPIKALPKRKPKDPYYDFHTMYGCTAYYLPYVNPLIQRQKPSREDSLPQYSSVKKQDKQVYSNVNKMINGFGHSNTQVTPSFKNTHFMRRPTEVPLSDWVKLGAPRMATNMIHANQDYRATNSKCRFHHLTKLKLHNYGISVAKHIQRCELVEFIGKANAAIKHENLKAKMHGKGSLDKTESSSMSFLKSF